MNSLVEEANEIFCKDQFATKLCGAKIESVSEEEVVCSMEITKNHLNAAGTVMGGAIFTLADYTFAIASNFHKNLTVSLDSQINYYEVSEGTKLIATSELLKTGRTTCFYVIHVSDDLGTKVADVHITGYIKNGNITK